MKNIVYVIGKLDIGGAELHLLNICKNISRDKVNISIFPLKRGGSLENEFKENDIEILGEDFTGYGKSGLILSSISLITYLRKNDVDLIHFFLPEAYVIGCVCSFFKPGIVRVMSRRSLNLYQRKYYVIDKVEKLLHKKTDKILGNSQAVIDELKKEGVHNKKLQLIYNYIDKEKFNIPRKNHNNELVFVCVANLIPYKGHKDLVEALSIADEQIPLKWKLNLIGRDEGYGKHLQDLSKERGLEEKIHFLGEIKSDLIPGILIDSDIGILCSHQEGFSNSILEYMAAGLPVIATNAGGNAEAVIDGKTGFIIPISDQEKIADAIIELSKNDTFRVEMGKKSKDIIQEKFTLEKCIQSYEELYNELIK